nr:hypothetical protein [uncultured Desulfobulbus sp.]
MDDLLSNRTSPPTITSSYKIIKKQLVIFGAGDFCMEKWKSVDRRGGGEEQHYRSRYPWWSIELRLTAPCAQRKKSRQGQALKLCTDSLFARIANTNLPQDHFAVFCAVLDLNVKPLYQQQ